MIIRYSRAGDACRDYGAEECVLGALARGVTVLETATENVIYAARALIATKKISHEDIVFEFNNEHLLPDETGRLAHWPRGFADHMDDWMLAILGWTE